MNWESTSPKPVNVLSLSISRKRKHLESVAEKATSTDGHEPLQSNKASTSISKDLITVHDEKHGLDPSDIAQRMDDDDMDESFWQQVIDIEQKAKKPQIDDEEDNDGVEKEELCAQIVDIDNATADKIEQTTPMMESLSVSDPVRKHKKLVGEDVFARSCVKEWQGSRIKAWEGRYLNAEGYYYRFVVPGEGQRNGGWSKDEHKLFMGRYSEWISRGWKIGASWGLFSKGIPHRVGYQCMNYYRKLVSDNKIRDESYAMVDGKLKQIHKDRAPTGEIPTTDIGSEWQLEDVKQVERDVDLWLREFHNRSGSAAVRSVTAVKTKAAPRVARTITAKKSNIGDLVKKQRRNVAVEDDDDDDFMMDSVEPEQANLKGSKYDWEKDWNERLERYKEFMRPYLDKSTHEAYWHAKQHWRQGLATTEMLLMRKPIQKAAPVTETNDQPKPAGRMQASLSRFFTGVKKVKVDTPDEIISNVRIPNDLYSGVKQITPLVTLKSRRIDEERVHYHELDNMMDCTGILESLLSNDQTESRQSPLEGILVDPPWEFYINDGRNDGRCNWNLKDMGDGFELRHQRSADVIIDFEQPRSQWINQEFTEPKPPAVYDMIETLLPRAGYDEEIQRGRFLELWAKSASPRREGWIAFHQKKHTQETGTEMMTTEECENSKQEPM
ncbi:hypothetical protein DFQ30_009145 [Apophysomyces sp. BC1015]|nr:hypothetical protein DFQ30_009145 [Apophysomyces sp. BC1015]